MFNSDILRVAPMKQVGGCFISFLQCVLVISGICRFWVSTHWLLHVIKYKNKEVARVQLRAAIQKQEKGPGTPLPESLSGFFFFARIHQCCLFLFLVLLNPLAAPWPKQTVEGILKEKNGHIKQRHYL